MLIIKKAFDRVTLINVMEILQSIDVDWKLKRLKKNLYTQQSAYVRVRDWKSEACVIERGVRLGYILLSPLSFHLYDEAIMSEATSSVN